MPKLTDISYVKELMEENGLSFLKKYGQNFLINESVPVRTAEMCCDNTQSGVIEIGPGIGTLTYQLAKRFARVTAVEIDERLIPVLGKTLSEFDNVTVINGDIMKLDVNELIREHFDGMDVCVCANLPYYITSPVIMKLLESDTRLDSITLLIQKEVADRLCAAPDTPEYGAITAAVNYYSKPRKLFSVSAGSFIPAPKVESTVIRLELYKDKPIKPSDEKMMFRIIKAAFAQRRKTLQNAVSNAIPNASKQCVADVLTELGFDVSVRGERLSIADFAAISNALSERIGH